MGRLEMNVFFIIGDPGGVPKKREREREKNRLGNRRKLVRRRPELILPSSFWSSLQSLHSKEKRPALKFFVERLEFNKSKYGTKRRKKL